MKKLRNLGGFQNTDPANGWKSHNTSKPGQQFDPGNLVTNWETGIILIGETIQNDSGRLQGESNINFSKKECRSLWFKAANLE